MFGLALSFKFLIGFLLSFALLCLYIYFSRSFYLGEKIELHMNKLNILHQNKKMTPTSGGCVFIPLFLILSLIFVPHIASSPLFWAVFGFFIIGLFDDVSKMFQGSGLSQRVKVILQTLVFIAIFFIFNLGFYQDNFLTFIAGESFLFIVFIYLWFAVLGTVNAVNLTDGLDGLCVTQCLLLVSFFLILTKFSSLPLCLILVSVLIPFYILNRFPARVFMGDSGSMALGAFVVFSFIEANLLYLLPLIGLVFMSETLSVMLQVAYYRRTKKRIFLATPIHHHFQLKGYTENQIVLLFLLVSFFVNMFVSIGFYLF